MPKPITSVERALRILEFFAFERRAANASEIQSALDLPQSSTSVLLHSLVELGYLEFLRAGRKYYPTQRVAGLGDWLTSNLAINLKSEKLDELCHITQETVLVARKKGVQAQYVRICLSNEGIQFYMFEGTQRPLSTSASGRALLSGLSDDAVRKIVRRNNAEAKSTATKVRETEVLAAIQKIRRTSISETDSVLGGGEQDFHTIAVLLPAHVSPDPLSLGVAGPRKRMLRKRAMIIETLHKWLAT